ncbi:hypothetical protein [Fibrobacter sp.]|uniref:hypothetical protein n=1 Tax=Fibrobacter sp. TaxID=35828 RepID=UPI003890EE1B
MSVIHIGCPHCGTSFDAQIQGEGANMMVFCCVRCKTPLMYFHGEVAELDRDEFAGLRQKLSRAIDAVAANDGTMAQVAAALKKMVDASNALADERGNDERTGEHSQSLPHPREGSAPSEFADAASVQEASEKAEATPLSDDALATLQKDLDELDVDSFLDKL